MTSPQPRAVVDSAVDYLSWKNKASTNRRFVLLKSVINHVWKMCMFCTDFLGEVCSLNGFYGHIQSFDI